MKSKAIRLFFVALCWCSVLILHSDAVFSKFKGCCGKCDLSLSATTFERNLPELEAPITSNDDESTHEELRTEGPAVDFQWKLKDSKWVIIPEGQLVKSRYLINEFVGQGGNGIVYGASDIKQSNERVALKFITRANLAEGNHEVYIWGQLRTARQHVLQAIRSHHVVGILETFCYDEFSVLVSPLFDHDLGNDNAFTIRIDFGAFQDFTRQMISALIFIHDRDIAHLDIKPGNIVVKTVSGYSTYALIDFGLAGKIGSPGMGKGTKKYSAPEVPFRAPASGAMDMWSLGVTLYKIITRQDLISVPRKRHCTHPKLVITHQHVIHFGNPGFNWLPHVDRELAAEYLQSAEREYQNSYSNEPTPPPKWEDTIHAQLDECTFSREQLEATIAFIKACLKWDPKERITAKKAQNHKLLTIQVVPWQRPVNRGSHF